MWVIGYVDGIAWWFPRVPFRLVSRVLLDVAICATAVMQNGVVLLLLHVMRILDVGIFSGRQRAAHKEQGYFSKAGIRSGG
ncbi:hypothetical protein LMG29739_01945 [Paraburkholderia solisilvae]|uniref:Uncharacterized protein n=1 Tax=Paraburkholderia solisilvae TaxID=624376 RepID=A0A6J5DK86_9BURK|nr:hypothetical protein LMG29739_01945 [Paraburkholderia solisilvae]